MAGVDIDGGGSPLTAFDHFSNYGGRQALAGRAGELPPRSGMGVASLVLAILSVVSIALLVVVVVTAGATFGQTNSMESPFNYALGGWMFATGLLCVVGIVFGVGGLLQANRRRGVAALGLCLNAAIVLGAMFLLLVAQTITDPSTTNGAERRIAAGMVVTAEAEAEPPAWKSPGARVFQCLTAAMGAALFGYYGTRGRRSKRRIAADVTACTQCGKRVAPSSMFCRRCGCAV
jgi:hypothetical protein